MDIDDYQLESSKFALYKGGTLYTVFGLIGELGELLSIIPNCVKRNRKLDLFFHSLMQDCSVFEQHKKLIGKKGLTKDLKELEIKNEDIPKLVSELGDMLWFISALATEAGVSLEYIASANLNKLYNRAQEGTLIDNFHKRGKENGVQGK